ncbi:hypothetical protein V6C03_10805 [Methyloligella sp. 2.7D]|uniref:hypothetical protein n=1 Tax=unclassified Methyloligella TaxID=2625955 RepID=UPI00157C504F|nr:hypothetical protein [Methyloligella sp. GL2]QKP77685.1 hypothetical protein HT051_09655 [Methyloligella sp. GL2]
MGKLLARELRKAELPDVLISTESFSHIFQTPELLDRVVQYFDGLGYEVAILYYLRHLPAFHNSAYSQVAKLVRTPGSLEDFIGLPDLRRSTVWRNIQSAQSFRPMLRPFNKKVRSEGIVRSVLGELGISDQPPEVLSVNESPGPLTVHLGRWLCRALEEDGTQLIPRQSKQCSKAIETAVKAYGGETERYMGLTSELAGTIEAVMEEEHEEMAQLLWGTSYVESFPGEVGRDYDCNDFDVTDAAKPPADELRALEQTVLDRSRPILADRSLQQRNAWPVNLKASLARIGSSV